MKHQLSKIVFLIVFTVLLTSCNSVKRVSKNEHLLVKNSVHVNDKKDNSETINNLLYQRKNRTVLNIPLRLFIYNTARPNIDSIVNEKINRNQKRKARLEKFLSKKQLDKYLQSKISFNKWIKKTGEAPVIVDETKTKKSENRLASYYINNGWFNTEVSSKTDKQKDQRASVDYFVKTGNPYKVDSLYTTIDTPKIDSIYKVREHKSFIKKNEQYKTQTFQLEKDRITNDLRNSGIFHFSQDYVYFDMDTIGRNQKVLVDLQIKNQIVRKQDSAYRVPFNIYKIKEVNIYTNNSYENKDKAITNSLTYNKFTFV